MRKVLIILSIAFLFISCDTESMSNKNLLIGTWEDTWTDDEGHPLKEVYTFTENDFIYYFDGFKKQYETEYPYNLIGIIPVNTTHEGTYQIDNLYLTFTINKIESSDLQTIPELPIISSPIEYKVTMNELTLIIPRGTSTITAIYKKIN